MRRKTIIFFLVLKALLLVVLLMVLFFTKPQSLPYNIVDTDSEPKTKTWEQAVIGYSHNDQPITAHHFGTGEKKLLLVGGIHGGYEWNTVVLAEEMITHFQKNPTLIPPELTLIIIPALNPDGLIQTFGTTNLQRAGTTTISSTALRAGRRNGRDVDLNRNFDCNWEPTAIWQSERIGAGNEPFSELEAQALRDFVLEHSPEAAIFWHSQAGAVYGAACNGDVTEENVALLEVYTNETSYQSFEIFTEYPVSGDVESWLTTLDIPALTVELSTRTESEFEENLAAVIATMNWLAQK